MDRRRFSLLAHAGIALWNPLPVADTLRLVDALDLGPDARLLDVGCGRAALLIRLLARTGAHGIGIDSTPAAIEMARADAAQRVDASRIELREEPFDTTQFAEHSFDVTLCIGASHAIGGYRDTLRTLRRLLVPGGTALVGEGFWRCEPDPEYLAFLGDTRESLLSHAGNLAVAREQGFDVVRSVVSDREAFDAYEEPYAANIERFVESHPDDSDSAAFLARIRGWRTAYLRWGRDTLGFALYQLSRSTRPPTVATE